MKSTRNYALRQKTAILPERLIPGRVGLHFAGFRPHLPTVLTLERGPGSLERTLEAPILYRLRNLLRGNSARILQVRNAAPDLEHTVIAAG